MHTEKRVIEIDGERFEIIDVPELASSVINLGKAMPTLAALHAVSKKAFPGVSNERIAVRVGQDGDLLMMARF